MRILFFINDLDSGGKERRLVELLKGLSKYPNIKMGVVLTRNRIHYKDILSLDIPIFYTIRKKRKDLKVFIDFYKIAKDFKPDIIHVWGNMVAIYAIPTKVLLKIPMLNSQITNSTNQETYSVLSHRLSFPFSNRIIANTYAGLDAYDAPKNKSLVIYNGFDFSRLINLESQKNVRDRFKITSKYVVAMVATFSDKKDYKTYIDGAIKILKKRNDITFLCIGSGDYSKYQENLEYDKGKNILFLGNHSDVESIMNICDIGVLMTYEKHGEGISNAILEFNALGKPVIGSNSGGTPEIIKDGVSGFLIKPECPEDLSEKILFLIEKDEKRHEFGENANEIVRKEFSISRMVSDFLIVYQNVLNSKI